MKTQLILAAVIVAALTPAAAVADSGIYLAANVGQAELSENFDGFEVDSDSTAFRVALGWRFNDYLAIDAGYSNFGRFEQSFDIDGTITEISLKDLAEGRRIYRWRRRHAAGRRSLVILCASRRLFLGWRRGHQQRVGSNTGGYEPLLRSRRPICVNRSAFGNC
jgi:opacity protein-like surface antigen